MNPKHAGNRKLELARVDRIFRISVDDTFSAESCPEIQNDRLIEICQHQR